MSQGTGGCSPLCDAPTKMPWSWLCRQTFIPLGRQAWGCLRTPVSATLLTYIPPCRREMGAILTHLCHGSSSCQGKCRNNDGEDGKRGEFCSSNLLISDQKWKRREGPIWCLAEAGDWELSHWRTCLGKTGRDNFPTEFDQNFVREGKRSARLGSDPLCV